jgi:hypothetical protein
MAKITVDAEHKAVGDVVALLRKKDKIYLEPVTMVGDGQIISESVFLGISGNAVTILPSGG